jgi:hypothetical protein
MTRRRAAEAVREFAERRSRGTLPRGWLRWAQAMLAGPTVPWRRVLASAVRRAIAHAAGCCDYSYSRPGRRRIARVVLPAMRRPRVNLAVVVDTSGSMGQSELDAAMAEIKGVIAAAEASRPRPNVVVVLTDGETPWPDKPTRSRLVAAIIGGRRSADNVPSWATTVLVDVT